MSSISCLLYPNSHCIRAYVLPECADVWHIPVQASTSSAPSKVAAECVLTTATGTLTLRGVAADEWVKLNPGTVGFYRTRYPSDMLARFTPAIRDKTLPPLDRLGLLDDLFALVSRAVRGAVRGLFRLYCPEEKSLLVWEQFVFISDCYIC